MLLKVENIEEVELNFRNYALSDSSHSSVGRSARAVKEGALCVIHVNKLTLIRRIRALPICRDCVPLDAGIRNVFYFPFVCAWACFR